MKHLILYIVLLTTIFSFAQEDKEKGLSENKANNFVHQGNELLSEDDFISAEMEYRKAISEQSNNIAGAYNLGHSYYKKGSFSESLYRNQQAAETSINKADKYKAYHNIGNILMQNKQCKEAVEAYKNALRNNPTDDETRYNLVIAKECAKQQEEENKDDQNKDQNKDQDENKDKQNEDKKDKEGDDKEGQKDKGDQDKKEGEDEEDDKGKPKDEKDDKGKGEDDKKKDQQKPKPQPGQLSQQQIKNLLEAMNNQEQKVQEKMNAEKVKGVKIKTEKDW